MVLVVAPRIDQHDCQNLDWIHFDSIVGIHQEVLNSIIHDTILMDSRLLANRTFQRINREQDVAGNVIAEVSISSDSDSSTDSRSFSPPPRRRSYSDGCRTMRDEALGFLCFPHQVLREEGSKRSDVSPFATEVDDECRHENEDGDEHGGGHGKRWDRDLPPHESHGFWSHGPPRDDPLDHGQSHHGPPHYGHPFHRPPHHYPLYHRPPHHGPFHHAPPHHGPPHHHPLYHGPPHHGPFHHEPLHHGPPHHAAPHHGPFHHGPPHHAAPHHGPSSHGPPHYGPSHRGPLHHGPPHHAPPHHGPSPHGPSHRGPLHHGPPSPPPSRHHKSNRHGTPYTRPTAPHSPPHDEPPQHEPLHHYVSHSSNSHHNPQHNIPAHHHHDPSPSSLPARTPTQNAQLLPTLHRKQQLYQNPPQLSQTSQTAPHGDSNKQDDQRSSQSHQAENDNASTSASNPASEGRRIEEVP